MNRISLTIDCREVQRKLEALKKSSSGNLILGVLDRELDDVADIWAEDSQDNIAKFTDTNELLGSLEIEREFLNKTVSYDAPHAIYVVMGTQPHMPPVEKLIAWARRNIRRVGVKTKRFSERVYKVKPETKKGSRKIQVDEAEQLGWAIAMKIKKEGTEPNDFFTPAVDRGVEYFKKRMLALGFKISLR